MGLRPGPAVVGYLNEKHMDRKCQVIIDPERGLIIKKIFENVAYEKWSGRKIYHWLRFEINFKTPKGNKGLTLSNIYQILQNPFYYGVFEYPVKSGNFYTGKHTPLITKELFDQVQAQVKNNMMRVENKEFAFTKLMACGLCGSGISADEKFKKLKDGSINRHVYYGCTKSRDQNCKCGYITEEELIKQLEILIEKIDINEIEIKQKIKIDVEKFTNLQKFFLGTKEKVNTADIDIRGYAKYVLQDGEDIQKRNLLGCFKSKITLKEKIISLSK
jgi:predicted metal-binding protein